MTDLHLAIKVFAALSIVLAATSACGRLATLVRQPTGSGSSLLGDEVVVSGSARGLAVRRGGTGEK
jgi:hypothetical protein